MSQPSVQLGWDDKSLQQGAEHSARIVDAFHEHVNESFKDGFGVEHALEFLGIAASLEGVKSLVEEFGKFAALGRELNEAPEALQRLSYVAQENNTDVQTLITGLQKFGLALRDADNPTAQSALKELNIDAAEFIKLSPERQLTALAEAFQSAERRGSGLNATFDLVSKTGSAMLPILRGDLDAMRELANAPVLSGEQIQTLDEFGSAWTRFVSTQKVQIASFALESVNFAKAFSTAWHASSDIFSADFNRAFHSATRAQKEHSVSTALAAEEGRKLARNMAAAREEADRADVAFKKFTKTLGEQVEHQDRLQAKLGALRDQISDIHLDFGTDDKLTAAKQRLAAVTAKIFELQSNSNDSRPEDEETILNLELEQKKTFQEILQLQKQIRDEEKARAKERDPKLEHIKKLQDEMALLRAQAAHHQTASTTLERQAKIREEAHRIAKETGVTEEQALKVAKEKVALEEKIANPRGRGIHGYRQGQASTRTEDNLFRGLDELARLNQVDANGNRLTAFQDKFGGPNRRTPGLDNLARLQDRSQPAFDTGVTRRASAADRAASHSAATPPDHGVEITRLLSSIDKHFADATRG